MKIPEDLVEKALSTLPKDFSITPTDAGPLITLGDDNLQLPMNQSAFLIELSTGTKRRGTTEDIHKGIAVANALENVRLVSGYCFPSDVPEVVADIHTFEQLWTYSRKVVGNWIYSARSAEAILEMAKVVAGSEESLRRRKLVTCFAEMISPLQYAEHTLEIVLNCCLKDRLS